MFIAELLTVVLTFAVLVSLDPVAIRTKNLVLVLSISQNVLVVGAEILGEGCNLFLAAAFNMVDL